MEGDINTSTPSGDIYEDILREKPDFSTIKSNKTIPDYGAYQECDKPILTEDPPRSLILNVCGDMIHRTCVRGIDKRGTLYCSCGKDDDSDPLLSLEGFEFNDDLFEKACDKCSEVISKVLLLRLDASVSKPLVLLPCRHKAHFECISNKSKLCPKCPSIDDLEKEGYYISPAFDKAPKKRKRKDDSRKATRGTKVQTIIRELSIRLASEVLIGAPLESSDMREVSNQFHKLYYEIDDAEKNGDRTNRDLVHFYFRFGKALSDRLAILLQSNPPQTAHTKLNKEVKEKLSKNANNGMVRKRTDTARKIYDIFNVIGEDKFLRIKSFTASSFSDLTR
ncbi:497_t:CDS:2, partial [Funneliformis mosseae]